MVATALHGAWLLLLKPLWGRLLFEESSQLAMLILTGLTYIYLGLDWWSGRLRWSQLGWLGQVSSFASLIFQQITLSKFSWKREEQDKNQPLFKHFSSFCLCHIRYHLMGQSRTEFSFLKIFLDLVEIFFSQSTPVNEIFSGVLRDLGVRSRERDKYL